MCVFLVSDVGEKVVVEVRSTVQDADVAGGFEHDRFDFVVVEHVGFAKLGPHVVLGDTTAALRRPGDHRRHRF